MQKIKGLGQQFKVSLFPSFPTSHNIYCLSIYLSHNMYHLKDNTYANASN